MKYIITENKLNSIFSKYMDSAYDLKYSRPTREFIDKNDDVFGYLLQKTHFYYGVFGEEDTLYRMFGDNVDELLFQYLINRFPEVQITEVE